MIHKPELLFSACKIELLIIIIIIIIIFTSYVSTLSPPKGHKSEGTPESNISPKLLWLPDRASQRFPSVLYSQINSAVWYLLLQLHCQ